MDSPYALHPGMLKSCSADVVQLYYACMCMHLWAPNTCTKHICFNHSSSTPTPPKVVLRKSFELKKIHLLIFSETETFNAKSWSVETIEFLFRWQLEILGNSQFSRPLCQRGCTEVSMNRLWQKYYYCDCIREL